MQYQQQHAHHPPMHQVGSPHYSDASPPFSPSNNASQYPQERSRHYAPSYGYDKSYGYDAPPATSYSGESRNYTDSQLGIGNYSTPRMPRHAAVLKDRGSAENSVGSELTGQGSDSLGYGFGGRGSHAKPLPSPALAGSQSAGRPPQLKEMRSPDGRHTPVREYEVSPIPFS